MLRASRRFFFNEMAREPNLLKIKNTWYARLFSMMAHGLSKDMSHRLFEKAYFISFNYDRTLEHFLTHSIKGFFNLELEEAAKIVDSADIIHPYGTVGNFDPERRANSRMRFGHVDYQGLVERASGIRTYTEEMQNSKIRSTIDQFVDECPIVVFLGFAFHEQNVRLLLPPGARVGQQRQFTLRHSVYLRLIAHRSPYHCQTKKEPRPINLL